MAALPVVLLLLLQTVASLKLFVPQTHKAWLGKNVQIPCSFAVDKPPVDRSLLKMIWYFQGKQVLSVDDKSVEIIDPRLSYVDRALDGGADLNISNASLSDGGLYKCSVIYGNQRKEAEIRLDIQAPPQVANTNKIVVVNVKSVLRCSVIGFYPVDIDVKWFKGSERLSNVTEDTPLRNQDGLYSVNSTVTIVPTEEDRRRNFSCRVQHESLQQPLQEIFQLLYGAVPSIHILPHTFIKNVQQPLVCLVSGFYPESIVVNWFLNGTDMEKTLIKRINSSAVEAVLHFLPTEENWGSEVSCVVEHDTLLRPQAESRTVHGKDLKRNYKYHVTAAAALLCALLGAGIIAFYVYRYRQKRHPKLRNITPSADGSFSLNVDHFYPDKISVTWEIFQPPSSKDPQALESTPLMQENQDGTFNVISTTESLRGKVDESEKYSLRAAVTHQKLKHPSYQEWTNQDKDHTRFVSPPELGEILVPGLMPGSVAQLQCTISRYYPDRLTVTWIKKVKDHEERIEACEKYKITPHRSEEQRDKTFTCTAGLTFSPSLEDQGSEIICRVTHPGLEGTTERSTGQLQVRVKPTSDRPIQLSITDSGDVTAALSLLNFYPKDIKTTWSYGRSQEKEPSEETATGNPDGTFSMITECNIPGEIFTQTDGKIRVTWKHEAMDKAESREMCVGHEDYPWCPQIVEMTPLILQIQKQTTVTCKISRFFPNNLTVTWYKKTGGLVSPCESYPYKVSSTLERSADNSYSCSSSLSFIASSQPEDLEFLCKVSHPSLKDPIERSTGRAMTRVMPQMEKPVKFSLCESGRVWCRTRFKKFYPSNIKITWTYGEGEPIPSTRKLIQTDDEQTFDATSECEIPWDYFPSGVRVTLEHESLTSPQHQDLHVKDFPWRPVIEEIEKPVLFVSNEATLQWKISQYFPNNLTVTLYKKKKGNLDLALLGIITPTAERQPDNTYSFILSHTFIPTIEDDGAKFICKVQHPSLEQHIQQTTGPIQVFAPPRMQGPIQWSLAPGGDVLCTLSLQSFYPKSIDIRWSCSANSYTREETYEDNADGTYNVRSECRVAQQNISDPDFRITVTWSHKSLGEPETREVFIGEAGLPSRQTISEIFTPTMRVNEVVKLHCDISGFFPQKLTVSWDVKERGRHEYVPIDRNTYRSEMTPEQFSDTGYRSTASLHFRPSLHYHHGVWFMCKVAHPALEAPIERSAGPLLITLPPERTEQPIVTPCGADKVLCSVKIRKFFPKKINVTWRNGENYVKASKTIIQENEKEEEVYDAISECTIPWKELRFPLRVTWEHEAVGNPQSFQLKDTEFLWSPTLSNIDLPVLTDETEAELQCGISGYFPDAVTVTWYKKEKGQMESVHGHDKYKPSVIESQAQPDSTFSCTARLLFTPTPRDQGSEIICRVTHPSLKRPLETSSGPLRVRELIRSPTLSDIDLPVLTDETEAELQCGISGYFPDAVTVTWYKKKGQTKSVLNNKYKPPVTESQAQPDSTFSCTARLPFTPTLRDQGSEIICRVEHPSLKTPLERSSGPLRVRVPPVCSEGPKIMSHSKDEVLCSVKITKFFPKYIHVNWINGESCIMASRTIIQVNEEEEAYDAISECTIPWKELRFPLQVTWEHEAMGNHRSFQLNDTGLLRSPTLSNNVLPVLTDETEAELQCGISGYCPDAVTVTWHKKKKGQIKSLHGNDKYKTSVIESQAQPDSTFSCTARLLFTPTLRDQESEIICRVTHPSLEGPLERSSGPLHVQGNHHQEETQKKEDSSV